VTVYSRVEEVEEYLESEGWDSLLDQLYDFNNKAGLGVEGLLENSREEGAKTVVANLLENHDYEIEEPAETYLTAEEV